MVRRKQNFEIHLTHNLAICKPPTDAIPLVIVANSCEYDGSLSSLKGMNYYCTSPMFTQSYNRLEI